MKVLQQAMDMKLESMGMSRSSKNKPDPVQCSKCGKDKPMTEIDHPFKKEKRWVHCACPCEIKAMEDFKKEQILKQRRVKIDKSLKISSQMEDIRSMTFANFKDRKGTEKAKSTVINAVDNFEERQKQGVFLFGETGNGKSHLTAAGGNKLIDQGYAVVFITEKDLFKRLEATKNFKNNESFHEIMGACLEADLLIWDDFLSSQNLTKDEKDYIFQIVNGRERANKPIWMTSNITTTEFSNDSTPYRLDDKGRTWWRLIGNMDCVFNKGTNHRKSTAMAQALGITVDEYEKR